MPDSENVVREKTAVRRLLYEFLAACYTQPPTPGAIEAVRSGEIQDLCNATASLDACARKVGPAIARESEADIHAAFMTLFRVPGGGYLAPYESVYRDSREIDGQCVRGLLMGQSAIDVQKWYRLAALEMTTDCKELPDHIGLELAYLAHLCRKEQEFFDLGDVGHYDRAREMQRDFLAGHVVPWIALLRDAVYEKSGNTFFRAVADLAVDFVQRDLASLEHALGASRGLTVPQYERLTSNPGRLNVSSKP